MFLIGQLRNERFHSKKISEGNWKSSENEPKDSEDDQGLLILPFSLYQNPPVQAV